MVFAPVRWSARKEVPTQRALRCCFLEAKSAH